MGDIDLRQDVYEFSVALRRHPVICWRAWLVYLLELLQVERDDKEIEVMLRELQSDIAMRRKAGCW